MSTLLNSCVVVLVSSPSTAIFCAWANCCLRASISALAPLSEAPPGSVALTGSSWFMT